MSRIDTPQGIADALEGTLLAGREIVRFPILDTGEHVLALDIDPSEVEAAWRAARALTAKTGLYPVVSTIWGAQGDLAKRLADENPFSRFGFECVVDLPPGTDLSPRAIFARARDLTPTQAIEAKRAFLAKHDGYLTITDEIDYQVERSQERGTTAFTEEMVRESGGKGTEEIELWALKREIEMGYELEDIENVRQPWFDPDNALLYFLPCDSGWEAFAYLGWWGIQNIGAEPYIAMGLDWEKRYGAELVAHYGTMLQVLVSRPPVTIEDAWTIAVELNVASPYAIQAPGTLLRDHARGLVGADRWFLHERP